MLTMSVYSETVVQKDNIITKIGEDAIPFVNDRGMFVSDGMGGTAAIRILDIFDGNNYFLSSDDFMEENIFDKVCHVLSCSDEEIKNTLWNYYQRSYESMFNPAMKTLYQHPKENSFRLKKSGFFGSHAIGLVTTYFLCQLEKYYRDHPDEDLGDTVNDFVMNAMPKLFCEVTNCFGLKLEEVRMDRLQHYASTFSAVFYREHEDSVELFLFNCGDSRIYLIDKDGMKMAISDQSKNGIVKEMVSPRRIEKGELKISCQTLKIKKPFIVMCMSDGFYEAYSPFTPMHMEGSLLCYINEKNSKEEFESKLTDWYQTKTFDDSHSMAMAAFGMETYQELKEFAQVRYTRMRQQYDLGNLPNDIFRKNYEELLNEKIKELTMNHKSLLMKDYEENKELRDYCIEQAKLKMALYGKHYLKLQQQLKEKLAGCEKSYDNLKKCVSRNYSEFSNSIPNSSDPFTIVRDNYQMMKQSVLKITQISFSHSEQTLSGFSSEQYTFDDFVKGIEKNGSDIEICINSFEKDISGKMDAFSNGISNIRQYFQNACEKFHEYIHKNTEAASAENQVSQEKIGHIIKCLLEEEEGIKNNENISVENVRFAAERKKIKMAVEEYAALYHEVEKMQEDLKNAEREAGRNYWDKNCIKEGIRMISHVSDDSQKPPISDSTYRQLDNLVTCNQEVLQYKSIISKKSGSFNDYLQVYLSYIDVEKREQIRKEGWM